MRTFKEIRDTQGNVTHIETTLTGSNLLNTAKLNKGNAFSIEERIEFNLEGKLPLHVETLEQQSRRFYAQYLEQAKNIQKNIFLNALRDSNETLFYHLVGKHIKEMLPILYTPTVGEAVERFSLEMRKPRGLYISYPSINMVDSILDNRLNPEVDLIVVTDGEGILGIGDQGVGGMNICTAKLAVYTLCGGVHPHRVLPIQLDVGTNNQKLLDDPMYLGWRHHRVSGEQYDHFIDQFVTCVQKKFPNVFLHWEDFGRENARRNLERYRDKMCTFNDDMQGTGAVALACILGALKASNQELKNQKIAIFGGGTAGCGIADQICSALIRAGLTEKEARQRFWIIDRDGLIMQDHANVFSFQAPYAHERNEVADWKLENSDNIKLLDVIKYAKPTILIGCSAVAQAFTKEVITTMGSYCERPIIFPLSNPTNRVEAIPQDITLWTEGRALIATGSPFAPVIYNNREIPIAQSNNAFIFPGLGLGVICTRAQRLTDNMLWAACNALSENAPILTDKQGSLLPDLEDARKISRKIAIAVGEQARKDGVAGIDDTVNIENQLNYHLWKPIYHRYEKVDRIID
ncbi:MAG: NAD-dependent malic enzyme [Legionellales bacterium]|nr:NAD-dependent malic enzyme [Legionellales bacterium]